MSSKKRKRSYNHSVIDIEKATFVPLVFLTNGVMGKEAENSTKDLQHYLVIKGISPIVMQCILLEGRYVLAYYVQP